MEAIRSRNGLGTSKTVLTKGLKEGEELTDEQIDRIVNLAHKRRYTLSVPFPAR